MDTNDLTNDRISKVQSADSAEEPLSLIETESIELSDKQPEVI